MLDLCTRHRFTFEFADVCIPHFALFEIALLIMSTVFADVSSPASQ